MHPFLLARYLESLKVITGVLVSSLGSFAAIVMLLALFWMVFSIVGLHVFGGLELDVFDETANFNSLINAMVLNFNVSGPMSSGISSLSHWFIDTNTCRLGCSAVLFPHPAWPLVDGALLVVQYMAFQSGSGCNQTML